MKDLIRLLAKEVKRIRALVDLAGEHNSVFCREVELETLRRILAAAIRKSLTYY